MLQLVYNRSVKPRVGSQYVKPFSGLQTWTQADIDAQPAVETTETINIDETQPGGQFLLPPGTTVTQITPVTVASAAAQLTIAQLQEAMLDRMKAGGN